MDYSATALLALLVSLIIHQDVVRGTHYRHETPVAKAFRWFILSVTAFYISDILWGVLYDAHLIAAVFADTMLYFAAMTASVFLWTRFMLHYLKEKNLFIRILSAISWLFLVYMGIILIVNLFLPLMFRFDEGGNCHAGNLRYVALAIRMLIFMSAAVYMPVAVRRSGGKIRRRHIKIEQKKRIPPGVEGSVLYLCFIRIYFRIPLTARETA